MRRRRNQSIGMREERGWIETKKKKRESVSALIISPDDWMDGCEGAEMITNNSL